MKQIWALALLFGISGAARADNFLVLPFFNQSSDKNLNWIGDSLAEDVRDALAAQGLVALDRPDRNEAYQRLSIRPYTVLTKASVVKIGQALDAEQVVYGEYDLAKAVEGSKSRGSLRITAHVLDLKHMKQGPEFGEVGALEDLTTLQRHLAWQTLEFVAPGKTPPEDEFTRMHPPVKVEAIESYIRGLLATHPEEQERLFTQAVRLDPKMNQAYFQLGKLDMHRGEYKIAADWLQKVGSSDVHFRESSFLLGLCRFHTGDYAGAEGAFRTVANVVPLNEVLNNLGAAQARRNLPEALDNFEKALEGDETDPVYHFNAGYFLWKRGEFALAEARFREVLERKPDDQQAKALLARCEQQSGPKRGETRMENLERLKANYEEAAWWQLKAALQPQKK